MNESILGLRQVAPNGTTVSAAETPFGYMITFDTPEDESGPGLITAFNITHDTLATLLAVLMKLPGGLRVPCIGAIHVTDKPEIEVAA
jgi:hypothetical protein